MDNIEEKNKGFIKGLEAFNQANPEEIIRLDLSNEGLTKFPEKIKECVNLEFLDLDSNNIAEIPKEIGQLKRLEYLLLKSNNIRNQCLGKYIDDIKECVSLKCLDLSFNNITEIPKEIGQLERLERLYLNSNNIAKIPKEIGQLENLIHLYLNSNNIAEIPKEIGRLENLIHLYLDSNNIAEIPKEIGRLEHLIHLYLNSNNIAEISKEIGRLEHLIHLYLNSNNIAEISKEIGRLEHLEYLYLEGNNISYLPYEIGYLTNLLELNVCNNNLQMLPSSVINLTKLGTGFDTFFASDFFGNNPFTESPEIKKIVDEDGTLLELFNCLHKLDQQQKKEQDHYNYINLKIPKLIQTPITQYLLFFKDYVEATKKKRIEFTIEHTEEELILVTNGNSEATLGEMATYFEEYVGLTRQKMDDWVLQFEGHVSRLDADALRLKLDSQILHLERMLKIAELQSSNLQARLSDKTQQNEFLKTLVLNFSKQAFHIEKQQKSIASPKDKNQLLLDLIDLSIRLLEQKYQIQIENLHTNHLVQWLRDKGYQASDQSLSGRSLKNFGEVDILIRKENGTPISIVEAFRLKSCGPENTIVASHLDKLLHDYDTAGHKRNFVVVYAEAKDFVGLWKKYQNYIHQLPFNKHIRKECPLLSFEERDDLTKSTTNIKVGQACHSRGKKIVEVFHIFINMGQ